MDRWSPMDTKRVIGRLMSVLLLVVTGCQQPASSPRADVVLPRKIAATNPAAYEWTRAIVGDAVEVQYFGPADDKSFDDWTPDRQQIGELQECGVIIGNGPGATFAGWVDRITLDPARLCQTTDAFDLTQFIAVDHFQTVHSHGPGGEHSHKYVVPNCWLDPSVAWQQVTFIADRLNRDFPELEEEVAKGLRDLKPKFDALNQRTENLRATLAGRDDLFVVSENPQAAYLLRAVGLGDRSLMTDPDTTPEQFTDHLEAVETEGAAAFVWIGEPKPEYASLVSDDLPTAIVIRVFDRLDPSSDWFQTMAANLDQLESLVRP